MRLLALPLLLFVASSAKVCDSGDKASANANAESNATASVSGAASAAGEVKATLAAPRIGGTVASADEFSVELAAHEHGLVEALVNDAHGALISEGVKLTALVQAKGNAAEKLELAFSGPRARFEGHAKAGVELAPGPVDITLDVGSKVHAGKLNLAVVLPEPRLGGHVLAAGGFSAELFAGTNGEVRAFIKNSAGADVKADADAKFKAIVNAQGGVRQEIALSFDPLRACFAGRAKAGVELAPGPLELVVDAKVGAGIGRLESMGLSVEASHGGQLIAVGDFSVELVAKGREISAFVVDASGKAHAAGDLDLKLALGAGADLALKWDAPSLSYVGNVAANVNLALAPIRVSLVAAGKAFVGGVASLSLAAKANGGLKGKLDVDTGAKLDAAAKAKLDAAAKARLDASAKLDALAKAKLDAAAKKSASASIKLTPPKLEVSKSASAGAKAGGGAKASAGIHIGL